MNLIPEIKRLVKIEGKFFLKDAEFISIENGSPGQFQTASILKEKICVLTGIILSIKVGGEKSAKTITLSQGMEQSEVYRLLIEPGKIILEGKSERALFWAVQTLIQIVSLHGAAIPCLEIFDFPDFCHRGFYHDVTRGKVPKLSTLKALVEKLAYYKINELQLYVEHTFAFSSIPELWAGKDPLTAEEILELDCYCKNHHIDLIPSMASFGHLYELLRLKRFEHLNELDIKASEIPHNLWDRMAHYTIDPANDESFELITSMIEEYLPLFSSKYFNICCDETFDLGKGKNKETAQQQGTGFLYFKFVSKLIDVVRRHGKTPMLWGDIVINHPEYIHQLSSDVIFLNWGYGADISDDNVRILSDAGVDQYVCPGAQGWSRFAYNIDAASSNIRKMVDYGSRYNAIGVLNTDWGDCGHVNSFSGLFHGMILGAALSWNRQSYSDNHSFDKAVAVLEWRDSSGTVCTLLRELGNLCFYHFGNLYAWVTGTNGLWDKESMVEQTDSGVLQKNYERALEIHRQFIDLRAIESDKLLEFDEILLSATATAWTLGLLLFKKCHEYHQNLEITISKEHLIGWGFNVLNEFVRLWRIRNKEAELQNVIAVFRAALEKIQVF